LRCDRNVPRVERFRFMRSLPKLALAADFVQNLETLSFGS
jgi:hypothetical protein